MKRRNFLKSATASAAPFFLNGSKVAAITSSKLYQLINNSENDKILIIIELNGGNDGLNTIVPIDKYDQLIKARPNIIIPPNKLLPLTDSISVHPVLGGLKTIYDEGHLSVVQSVGYANQNGSHFRSRDIWLTASDADKFVDSGWIGRFMDETHPTYPTGYPNSDNPDPIAISVGSFTSQTCQGAGYNFSYAVTGFDQISTLEEAEAEPLPDNNYGKELDFLRTSIKQNNLYGERFLEAGDLGQNLYQYWPNRGENELADQLQLVSRFISGGLKTKVYVVSLGGFDTHADQVESNRTDYGVHADLLEMVSKAIFAFQRDLELSGHAEKVTGMTFSEFGRRIKSNGSGGTDHGAAAPLLVFGHCVKSGIIGDNPEIPEEVEEQDSVQMQYDFRSVYGSLLIDLFEADESSIKEILFPDFQYLPIIQGCENSTSTNEAIVSEEKELIISNYPNPFYQKTTIQFDANDEWMKLSVFDARGAEIKILANQRFAKGTHTISFDGNRLPAGNYYYRLQTDRRQQTKLMVKI